MKLTSHVFDVVEHGQKYCAVDVAITTRYHLYAYRHVLRDGAVKVHRMMDHRDVDKFPDHVRGRKAIQVLSDCHTRWSKHMDVLLQFYNGSMTSTPSDPSAVFLTSQERLQAKVGLANLALGASNA